MSSERKPEYDANGKEINQYIPKFIAKAPWYIGASSDGTGGYLSHQRIDPTKESESYQEARPGSGINDKFSSMKEGPRSVVNKVTKNVKVKKFPPGACTNCGSLSHKRLDCVERPRKFGAVSTGIEVAEKSFEVKQSEGYDSKRDRWHGYDASNWDEVVKNWETIKMRKDTAQKKNEDDDDDEDTDYELELEELGLSRKDIPDNLKEDPEEKTLRDRGDVPAYLKNIKRNVNYDPKTRSTRELTEGFLNDEDQFVRYLNGEGAEFQKLRRFAWEADQNNKQANQMLEEQPVSLELNPDASPTAVMLAAKRAQEALDAEKRAKKQKLLSKYGGYEYSSNPVETSDTPPSTKFKSKNDVMIAKSFKNFART